MARKKTEEAASANVEDNVSDANTERADTTDIQQDGVDKQPSEEERKKPQPSDDIPEDVKAILKCFPNEDALYVSKYGGTFPKDSEPFMVADAILYKNPFYNS